MSQEHAIPSGSKHLLEHPCVCSHGCFIYSIDRHIDNNCGSSMTAFGRTAGRQSLHILGETFDVIWSMFHVIADVIGIRLSVFLPLLEITLRAGMRTGVINRLPLREQIDCSIDPLGLWCLGHCRGDRKRCQEHKKYKAPDKLPHRILPIFPKSCAEYNSLFAEDLHWKVIKPDWIDGERYGILPSDDARRLTLCGYCSFIWQA